MTTIITKNGTGVPANSSLATGELAVDTTNKRIYTSSDGTNVFEVGTNPSTLTVDTDTLYVDAANNRVGVGDTGPTTKLSVQSGTSSRAIAAQSSTSGAYVAFQDSTTSSLGHVKVGAVGNDLNLFAGANPRMVVTSSGNVGIGETNPDEALEVAGDIKVATGAFAGVVHFGQTSDAAKIVSLGASSATQDLEFHTNSTERMRIASSGNVGIGESPVVKFQVNDGTNVNAGIRASTNLSGGVTVLGLNDSGSSTVPLELFGTEISLRGATSEGLRVDSSGNVGIGDSSTYSAMAGKLNFGYAGSNNTEYNGIQFLAGGNTDGTAYVNMKRGASSAESSLLFGTSNTTRMTIDSSGNVGIGTSTPFHSVQLENGDFTGVPTAGTPGTLGLIAGNSAGSGGSVIFGALQSEDGFAAIKGNLRNGNDNTTGNLKFYTRLNTTDAAMAERMIINYAGNVGIGTQSPASKFAVTNGTNSSGLEIIPASGSSSLASIERTGNAFEPLRYRAADHRFEAGSSQSEAMRIDTSGNVGIGNAAPAYSLTIGDGTDTQEHISLRSTDDGKCYIFMGDATDVDACRITYENNTNTLLFSVNGNQEAMRIDPNGNLLVGKTSISATDDGLDMRANGLINHSVSTNGQAAAAFYSPGGGNTAVGSITAGAATTSYNTSSDVRLKENIQDADSSGSIIDAIQVRQYDWKADGSHDDYGFVAQELEQVYPKAVSKGETEEDTWGVDYSKLVPLLVKEIQELKAEVAALKGA